MKSFFYSVCIVSAITGIAFYWVQGQASDPKTLPAERHHVQKYPAATEIESVQSTKASSLQEGKKGCGCCRSALEKVRQKRKELEMWAREMINTHGYEEGMKRVTVKSPTLAKRVHRLLEKEKNSRIPTASARGKSTETPVDYECEMKNE